MQLYLLLMALYYIDKYSIAAYSVAICSYTHIYRRLEICSKTMHHTQVATYLRSYHAREQHVVVVANEVIMRTTNVNLYLRTYKRM